MNRFRKYKLVIYHRDKGVRMIVRYQHAVRVTRRGRRKGELSDMFRVQSHKRFLGIPYWKTLIKTTSYKIAKDAYDLMVRNEKIGF